MVDKQKVEEVLQAIRPNLQQDGGDIELVEVTDDGVVKVQLQGACHGCPMSQITLSQGVERVLKEQVPGVVSVVPADVPDDFLNAFNLNATE